MQLMNTSPAKALCMPTGARHLFRTKLPRRLAMPLFLLCGVLLAQPCAATPFQWALTGSLNTGRHHHTATLLSNGQVLVVGGFVESGATASAELYDPALGTWSPTGDLKTSRSWQTATLLRNGMVLVAGGSHDSNATASAELYDPTSGTWSVTGSLNTARLIHTAILLPDGKVLIVGGLDRNVRGLQSAEIYDPASGTWTNTGSLVHKHDPGEGLPLPLTLLPDGNVLLEGGLGEHSESSVDAELYDPASGTWRLTGSLVTAREAHSASLLLSGKVLVAAGLNRDLGDLTSAELYDPATETWSVTGSLLQKRERHTATLLSNGMVLVAGGSTSTAFTTEAELYDPGSATWSVTGSLNAERADYTATLLPNGMVLAAAGDAFVVLKTAELYDPGITATQVSGRGSILGQGDTANFTLRATQLGDRASGSLTFSDPAAGVSFSKAKVRTLTFHGDNSADFGGNGRLGDGTKVTFSVSVSDNGSGGSSDSFSISLSNGYSAGGTLTSGNIKLD